MKVCIVTSYAPSIISFRGSLIKQLIAEGHTVHVLAPGLTPDLESNLMALGASCSSYYLKRTSLSPIADLHTFFCLYRAFTAINPDALLTYFIKPNIWAIIAGRWASIPRRVLLVEGMGYSFTRQSNGKYLTRQKLTIALLLFLYRFSIACAHYAVTLNTDDLQLLRRYCSLPPIKSICLGGIGVPLDEWKLQPPHLEPLVFTMIGRFLREKGVLEYLKAATSLKIKHPNVQFLLVGYYDQSPGALTPKDLFITDDNTNAVQIILNADVPMILKNTSVFVLPSYREGLPRSSQEALAVGRPIITTDVPGCRETVIDSHNGFLIPARNSQAIELAMSHFIANPDLITSMGHASRKIAENRFDISVANSKLIKALLG